MTRFERNARYSLEEKLNYLKQHGYDSVHLRTFSYKGFDVIAASRLMHGIHFYFYKDNKLVKLRTIRREIDITHYIKAYIDLELLKETQKEE